jgi:hypothetical protein
MQGDLAGFTDRLTSGQATVDDVLQITSAYPEIAEQVQASFAMKSEAQKAGEIQRSLRLATALKNSPDYGSTLLDQEIEAAEAAGKMDQAAALKSIKAEIGVDPMAPVASIMVTLATLMPSDQFKLVAEQLMPTPEKAPDAFRTLQLRAEQAGLQPGTPEYQTFMEQGGAERGPAVQVVMPAESTAFDKALGQGQADQALAISNQGTVARRNRNTLLQLRDTLAASPSGAEAGIKSFAGNFGIDTEGLSEIQAAEALISQLVPTQRPPGSGTMSDADLALYKKSLPRIINQAGGNEKIIRTTLAINEYLIKEAEIADQVINREISPADGRAKMAALVNPLAQSGGSGATPGRRKFDAQGREIK